MNKNYIRYDGTNEKELKQEKEKFQRESNEKYKQQKKESNEKYEQLKKDYKRIEYRYEEVQTNYEKNKKENKKIMDDFHILKDIKIRLEVKIFFSIRF